MNSYLKVGIITQTHGIHGEVKVFPTTDDPMRFKKLKEILLDYKGEYINLEISGVKLFKQYVILKFKDIDDINEVEKYKGSELFVTRQNAVKLKKDEYFIADLIGIKAISDDNKYEGIINDVLQTGANDVYEVLLSNGKTAYLPAIKECIIDVNIENSLLTFHMMNGLIDDEV
ncbi:MAG: ribosome maturation factor RimM [Lachnospiraceae bacterium]|nr:ribosome maturation factor RimM [Lachnospiraceae bacterium]